ncbi:MAG: sensor histidine kinase [Myxococcales bacterium]|nr:sensor histidine kinase [Myxococcales bacterium]
MAHPAAWEVVNHAPLDLRPLRVDQLLALLVDPDERLEAEPCEVLGDHRRVEIALHNLLINARTHGRGVARVRVAGGRIEFHDRGAGVAVERLELPPAAEVTAGSGLALVRRVAALHGGRLELTPVVALVLPQAGER